MTPEEELKIIDSFIQERKRLFDNEYATTDYISGVEDGFELAKVHYVANIPDPRLLKAVDALKAIAVANLWFDAIHMAGQALKEIGEV